MTAFIFLLLISSLYSQASLVRESLDIFGDDYSYTNLNKKCSIDSRSELIVRKTIEFDSEDTLYPKFHSLTITLYNPGCNKLSHYVHSLPGLSISINFQSFYNSSLYFTIPEAISEPLQSFINNLISLESHSTEFKNISLTHCSWTPWDSSSQYIFCYWSLITNTKWNFKGFANSNTSYLHPLSNSLTESEFEILEITETEPSKYRFKFSQSVLNKKGDFRVPCISNTNSHEGKEKFISNPIPRYFETHIERTAKRNGMSNTIETTIHLNDVLNEYLIKNSSKESLKSYKINILEYIPEDFYLKKYEVENIENSGGPKVHFFRPIDLEKPSFLSSQNLILISHPLHDNLKSIKISLPVYLRYQRPSWTGDDVKIVLPFPTIWINSEDQKLFLKDFFEMHTSPSSIFISPSNNVSDLNLLFHFPTGNWKDEAIVKTINIFTRTIILFTLAIVILKQPNDGGLIRS